MVDYRKAVRCCSVSEGSCSTASASRFKLAARGNEGQVK
jgi:hypothetical protein